MKRQDFLPLARPDVTQAELDAVAEVIRSGWWTTGPKVFEFEKALADYLTGENNSLTATAVNSCTSGLFLSLLAHGISPGDEVIVPTWTFAATAQVVEWAGAKLILCDIDEHSLNIDVNALEKCINNKTRAIIPVHIAGYPCDMDAINELAGKYDIKVIEDAAHAIGTQYNGSKIGNFSDVTCFSFYATKNLAMGEGGAVVSRDPAFCEKIAKLAYFGINKEAHKRYSQKGTWFYDIEGLGYKCNLDSIHAALGLVQLSKVDAMNERRREIAAIYKKELDRRISFTKDSIEHYHTYHLFPIILPENIARDQVNSNLKEENIGSSVHFIPLHRHSYYHKKFPNEKFPVADRIFDRILSIPMFPAMTEDDIGYVIERLNIIVRSLL